MCPRSSDPFYIETILFKMGTTLWTDSMREWGSKILTNKISPYRAYIFCETIPALFKIKTLFPPAAGSPVVEVQDGDGDDSQ